MTFSVALNILMPTLRIYWTEVVNNSIELLNRDLWMMNVINPDSGFQK